jgi:hypothetical protein
MREPEQDERRQHQKPLRASPHHRSRYGVPGRRRKGRRSSGRDKAAPPGPRRCGPSDIWKTQELIRTRPTGVGDVRKIPVSGVSRLTIRRPTCVWRLRPELVIWTIARRDWKSVANTTGQT